MPNATHLDRKLADGDASRGWGVAKRPPPAADRPRLTAAEKFGCSAPGFEAALDRALSREARRPLHRFVATVDLAGVGPSLNELNNIFHQQAEATRRRYAAARRSA
jgi:hypothetical protein